MTRCLALIVIAVAILAPAIARAECDLRLRDVSTVRWRGPTGAGYAVFDPIQRTQLVDITVQRRKGACPFFLGFVSASSRDPEGRVLRAGAHALRYQLYRDASLGAVLRDWPEATPSEILSGTAVPGQDEYRFQFVIALPALQVVAAETYEDEVRIRLYEGTIGSALLRDEKNMKIRADVPRVAELSFRNSGVFDPSVRTTTLRFDPLRTGATGTVSLWARGNAGYRVFVQSLNGGFLRHVDPTDPSLVAYTLRVDSAAVSLGRKSTPVSVQSGATSPDGREHVFDVTIGTVDVQSAGEYSDIITVTLTTL